MESHAVKIFKMIEYVLDSDLTDYAISKAIGDKSANYVSRLRSGESKITDMRLDKASRFEYLYNKLIEESAD